MKGKLKIEYDPLNGFCCADGQVDEYVKSILCHIDERIKSKYLFRISNGLIIHAFRAAICRGEVSHKKIVFLFKGQKLLPNKDGRLENWPKGFCDSYDAIISVFLN